MTANPFGSPVMTQDARTTECDNVGDRTSSPRKLQG